ncbi:ABC transporter substrate-binding protein [Microbacterium kribbense]|uniref:ABC transporter substrate-binding protein n=1 Tax=Microbacterium kribbense TaxID=433645 RepID=UPI0031CFEDDF
MSAVVLFGVVLLIATACSSPSAAPTASGDATALTKLKAGICVPNDADLALPPYVAQESGFFTDEGLDVEIVSFQGGADMVKGIVGGSVDVGVCGAIDAVAASAKGIPMKIVAGIGGTNPSALMVPDSSTISDISELDAATTFGIGRFGGVTDFVARLTSDRAGVPSDKFKAAAIGPDGLTAAVEAGGGDIDVFQWVPNSAITFESQGKLRTIATVADVFPEDQYSAVLAQPEYISSHKEVIGSFLAAFFQAVTLMKEDRGFAEKAFVERLNVPQENVGAVYEATVPRWSDAGEVSTAGLETYAEFLPMLGLAKTSPSLSDFYTDEFLPVKTD